MDDDVTVGGEQAGDQPPAAPVVPAPAGPSVGAGVLPPMAPSGGPDAPGAPVGAATPVGAAVPASAAPAGSTGPVTAPVDAGSTPVVTAPEVDADDEAADIEAIDARLDEVEQALRRIDAGTYGQCDACGSPIDDARLAELPTARRCAACTS